jgi:hypothetical protein
MQSGIAGKKMAAIEKTDNASKNATIPEIAGGRQKSARGRSAFVGQCETDPRSGSFARFL